MHEMITIRRHIQEREHEYTEATGQLSELLYAIALAYAFLIRRETDKEMDNSRAAVARET